MVKKSCLDYDTDEEKEAFWDSLKKPYVEPTCGNCKHMGMWACKLDTFECNHQYIDPKTDELVIKNPYKLWEWNGLVEDE